MRYEPTFDGLRAIAILAVIAFHTGGPSGLMNGGFLGVDVFFVLSVFLNTTLLIEEKKATGSIDLLSFYARRMARLTPALLLFLCFYLVFEPLVAPDYGISAHFRDAVLTGLYLSDYAKALWDVPDILRHTWSLSVEFHYYALWPLLMLGLARCRNADRLLTIALVVAFAWKVAALASAPYDAVYYRFDTRLSGLLLGSLLALRLERSALDRVLTPLLSLYAGGMLLLLFAIAQFGNKLALVFGGTAAEISTAILIGSLVRHRASAAVQTLLAHRAAVTVGKLSYGMYLWHFPLALLLRDRLPFLSAFLIVTTASMLLAAISYVTVEALFRKSRLVAATG